MSFSCKKVGALFIIVFLLSSNLLSQALIKKTNYAEGKLKLTELSKNSIQKEHINHYILDKRERLEDCYLEIIGENNGLTFFLNGKVFKKGIGDTIKLLIPAQAFPSAHLTIVNNRNNSGYSISYLKPKIELKKEISSFSFTQRAEDTIQEFKWGVLFFLLIAIVLIKSFFPTIYLYIKSLNFSNDFFISSSTISSASLSPFLISGITFLLSATFYSLILSMHATIVDEIHTTKVFVKVFFSVFLFLVIKSSLAVFFSYLFGIKNAKLYILVYSKIVFLVSLVLFLIYLATTNVLFHISFLYLTILLVSSFGIALFWVSYFVFRIEKFRISYLISYICSAEILPMLFLLYLLTF